jgi:CHAT domain-containing protein
MLKDSMFTSRKIGALALSLTFLVGSSSGNWAQSMTTKTFGDGKPASAAKSSGSAPAAPTHNNQPSIKVLDNISIPALPEVPLTQDAIDKILHLEAEAQSALDKKEYGKSLIKWQEAYGLALETKYSEAEGRALTGMCNLFLQQGKMPKAKELGENAVEILSGVADKKSLGQARVALAQAYLGLDNPIFAGQQLDEALKLFSELGATDAPESAKLMSLVGGILIRMDKFKEAINFLHGAANYYGQSGELTKEISTRMFLTSLMNALGWSTAALEEAQKTLTVAKQFKDQDTLASVYGTMGGCQYNLAEFGAARQSFEESLKLMSKNFNPLSKANVQAGYGHTLAAVGDLEQGRELILSAITVIKSKGTLLSQAQNMNTLGCIESMLGHYPKAITIFQEGLETQAVATPKQDKLRIIMLQNIAATFSAAGEFRNAKAHLDSALEIAKRFSDPILEGRTYSALGEVEMSLKDVPGAEAYLRKGLAISQRINDDAALWRDYTLLARIQQFQGLPQPEIHESMSSALSFFRSPQAGSFPSPERLNFPSSRENLAQLLVSELVSENQTDKALQAAEQLKEESFINEWYRRGGQVKPEDREIYKDLALQRAHLHAAEATSTPNRLMNDWKNWLTRFTQLARESRTLARLIAPVPTNVPEIIRSAQDNRLTIIDYLVADNTTIVFTIDSTGKLTASKLPVGNKQLAPQVASLFSHSENGTLTDHKNLQNLYSELLPEKIRAVLPQNPDQTVVIIPDGVLFNLPFAALIDPQSKYLVENHTLTMATSMGVFLDIPPRYTSEHSLIVAIAPTQHARDEEANMISSVFEPEQVTRLNGKDAEIGTLQEQAKGKGTLHFPNNLSLQDSNPFRSVVPLLSVAKEGEAPSKVTANRLFEINLPNDLAVWSASSVNAKDLHGNAVRLFSRGLSYAGVRNVMMSLWVEPDASRTSELIDFYKSRGKGLNQAQALRKAQLLALSKNPSPRTWAAFQLLGPGQ